MGSPRPFTTDGVSDGVPFTEEFLPSVAASRSNNGINGLADIIHQRLLSVTAVTLSSPPRRGQLFGESSDIDPQAIDSQKDVMAEWRADCRSDMGMGFFSMPPTTVNRLIPRNSYTPLAAASPNPFKLQKIQQQQNADIAMVIQHQQFQQKQQQQLLQQQLQQQQQLKNQQLEIMLF